MAFVNPQKVLLAKFQKIKQTLIAKKLPGAELKEALTQHIKTHHSEAEQDYLFAYLKQDFERNTDNGQKTLSHTNSVSTARQALEESSTPRRRSRRELDIGKPTTGSKNQLTSSRKAQHRRDALGESSHAQSEPRTRRGVPDSVRFKEVSASPIAKSGVRTRQGMASTLGEEAHPRHSQVQFESLTAAREGKRTYEELNRRGVGKMPADELSLNAKHSQLYHDSLSTVQESKESYRDSSLREREGTSQEVRELARRSKKARLPEDTAQRVGLPKATLRHTRNRSNPTYTVSNPDGLPVNQSDNLSFNYAPGTNPTRDLPPGVPVTNPRTTSFITPHSNRSALYVNDPTTHTKQFHTYSVDSSQQGNVPKIPNLRTGARVSGKRFDHVPVNNLYGTSDSPNRSTLSPHSKPRASQQLAQNVDGDTSQNSRRRSFLAHEKLERLRRQPVEATPRQIYGREVDSSSDFRLRVKRYAAKVRREHVPQVDYNKQLDSELRKQPKTVVRLPVSFPKVKLFSFI